MNNKPLIEKLRFVPISLGAIYFMLVLTFDVSLALNYSMILIIFLITTFFVIKLWHTIKKESFYIFIISILLTGIVFIYQLMARGLYEALDEDYLPYRIGSMHYLGEKLTAAGVPMVLPTGGHAIYLDAKRILPHIPPLHYPGWALNAALYVLGGVRGSEIGSVMFGMQPDGTEKPAAMELVRLAFPRRVYTQSHADYLIEVIVSAYQQRDHLTGYKIVDGPELLRHFSARLEPLIEK